MTFGAYNVAVGGAKYAGKAVRKSSQNTGSWWSMGTRTLRASSLLNVFLHPGHMLVVALAEWSAWWRLITRGCQCLTG